MSHNLGIPILPVDSQILIPKGVLSLILFHST